MKCVALMYHDIVAPGDDDASGFPGAAAAHYKLDVDAFARHLAASGPRFGPVNSRADGPQCALTFDDGGASAMKIAALLGRHGMTGHFFVTTSRVGTPGFATGNDLGSRHAAGHVIGSHSHTHPGRYRAFRPPPSMPSGGTASTRSRRSSVPGGFYARHVASAAARAGVRWLFTFEPTTNTHVVNDCVVLGRYTLWPGMPLERAVALALGTAIQRERQWLNWNAKKPLKRWGHPVYGMLRHALLTR